MIEPQIVKRLLNSSLASVFLMYGLREYWGLQLRHRQFARL